ncbi:hypothetical protein LJC33_01700 [Eubacteriales bacterium OttesenSCG-928-N13]|nr:hypothetical protein [Eubacteriales bacterium OttesenSCG-928-N13]
MTGPYDDIINLPHHVSTTRQQMPRANRAAQFAPFAALTGYDSAINETARLTDKRKELDEQAIVILELKMNLLAEAIDECPEVSLTYFQPDEKKKGGAYVTATGALKKIDDYERVFVFIDGKKVALEDVLEIESEIFGMLND